MSRNKYRKTIDGIVFDLGLSRLFLCRGTLYVPWFLALQCHSGYNALEYGVQGHEESLPLHTLKFVKKPYLNDIVSVRDEISIGSNKQTTIAHCQPPVQSTPVIA